MGHTAKEEFALLLLLKVIYDPGRVGGEFSLFPRSLLLHFDLSHLQLCNETESLKKEGKKGKREEKEGKEEGGREE